MQTFRPADVDLAAVTKPARGFSSNADAGSPDAPVTRSAVRLESSEGGLRSGVWESYGGAQGFRLPGR